MHSRTAYSAAYFDHITVFKHCVAELSLRVELVCTHTHTHHYLWSTYEANCMQAQQYSITNFIMPSKYATVWCYRTVYLIVVAYTDVLHNHLHTDIQDCHQALQVGNSVTDHIWSTETGTGQMVTGAHVWMELCQQHVPWELRQTNLLMCISHYSWCCYIEFRCLPCIQAVGCRMCKNCFTLD